MANSSAGARIAANPAMAGRRSKPASDAPDQGEPPEAREHAPAETRTVRTRKVRRTVDLSPNAHRDLGRWCDDLADALGLSRVTSQDVLTALVAELLEAGSDSPVPVAIRRRIEQARR